VFVLQTLNVLYPKPEALNRLIHEPVRLHIVTQLASAGGELRFTELRRRLGVTQGNLASHLRALAAAGIVETVHLYGEPRAEYFRLTPQGREDFFAYLEELNAVLALL
jgi:DNA-binding HxlR family transcriptional regulator